MNVDRDTVIGMHSAIDRERQEEVRLAARERTAAATAGRMRASENRGANKLESRGWMCFPPEEVAAITEILTRAGWKVRNPR